MSVAITVPIIIKVNPQFEATWWVCICRQPWALVLGPFQGNMVGYVTAPGLMAAKVGREMDQCVEAGTSSRPTDRTLPKENHLGEIILEQKCPECPQNQECSLLVNTNVQTEQATRSSSSKRPPN